MTKTATIKTISSGYASNTQLNFNFEALNDKFDNTLSLDGSTPNSMGADLDMNGNDILNTGNFDVDTLTVDGATINDSIIAAADAITNADVVLTGLDRVATNADAATTTQDALDTAADVVLTHADVVLTHADVVTTTQDALDTAADVVLTGLDVASTNADVVITSTDVILSTANADAAAASALIASAGEHSRYNHIINGDFDVWQRGNSQTAAGYGSVDRWSFIPSGTGTTTFEKVAFALGQTDVPNNPENFLRITKSSGATGGDYFLQRIEDVTKLSGETITLTLWMKASAATTVYPYARQSYGTGGSPSAITDEALTALSVSTTFEKHSITYAVPSISGKTLGTSGSDNMEFFFNIVNGANDVLEVSHVSIVRGDATGETDPFTYRSYGEELALCHRYFFKGNLHMSGVVGSASGANRVGTALPVQMRTTPDIALSGSIFDGIAVSVITSIAASYSSNDAVEVDLICSGGGLTVGRACIAFLPALLELDAEL